MGWACVGCEHLPDRTKKFKFLCIRGENMGFIVSQPATQSPSPNFFFFRGLYFYFNLVIKSIVNNKRIGFARRSEFQRNLWNRPNRVLIEIENKNITEFRGSKPLCQIVFATIYSMGAFPVTIIKMTSLTLSPPKKNGNYNTISTTFLTCFFFLSSWSSGHVVHFCCVVLFLFLNFLLVSLVMNQCRVLCHYPKNEQL